MLTTESRLVRDFLLHVTRPRKPRPQAPANACVSLAGRRVGEGEPVYVIAEIGIDHNGSLDLARRLIEGAKAAGCDAVKFQKRTPELCVPRGEWDVQRDTPWGRMKYIDYKRRMEFGEADSPRSIDSAASFRCSGSPRAGTCRRSSSWSASTRLATRWLLRRSPTSSC